jgi:purine-binding chemotaxis protein CheW
MAEARKRARQGKGAPAPRSEPPEAEGKAAPAPSTRPSEPGSSRIALPASGLAADILARADAAAVAPNVPVAATAEPAVPVVSPAAASHNLSFFSVPAQEERKAAETTEHLATFILDREEYAVDVHVVQEIRRVTEITPVPRAPEFIRGVINLRGRILPVVDLKRKLHMGQVDIGRGSRIVVVRLRDRLLGLLVDGAHQVLKVPRSKIEPPPEEVVAGGGDYIRGVAKLDDRLIILVDLLRILSQELREGPATAAPS